MASFTTSSSSSPPNSGASRSPAPYSFNSRIMVAAIAVLFIVIFFVLCLHVYAKWFWKRHSSLLSSRRMASLQRQQHHQQHYFATMAESLLSNGAVEIHGCGLDSAVMESLPTFCYEPSKEEGSVFGGILECAVCLSEFQKNEKGRMLPDCSHVFHTDCIDMWFHSHTTCPLCRKPVTGERKKKKKKRIQPWSDEEGEAGDSRSGSFSSVACTSLQRLEQGSNNREGDSFVEVMINTTDLQVSGNDDPTSRRPRPRPRSLSQISMDRYVQGGRGGVSRCLSFSCVSRQLRGNEEEEPQKSYSFRIISIKRLLSMERNNRGSGSSSKICHLQDEDDEEEEPSSSMPLPAHSSSVTPPLP